MDYDVTVKSGTKYYSLVYLFAFETEDDAEKYQDLMIEKPYESADDDLGIYEPKLSE